MVPFPEHLKTHGKIARTLTFELRITYFTLSPPLFPNPNQRDIISAPKHMC
jgi:hypothetical protein